MSTTDSRQLLREKSLEYHSNPEPGKIHVVASKPCETQDELSLAYTPGVAEPCLAIKEHPEDVYKYTGKCNTVAVVSDGTAVLGLGNIGPEAGLPVMEGKAVLFKRFAGIDAIPLCLGGMLGPNGKTDADRLIEAVAPLEPTFGGINLEDIGGPACFKVERTLKQRMNIPVFHDDQHGTAIISLAALINACRIKGRKLEEMKVVVNGAGAAGIACSMFYIAAGIRKENLVICDSKGVIYKGRPIGMTPYNEVLATERPVRTLQEAIVGADIFLGASIGNCVTKEMVRSMAPDPIIFAMANPTPEISPADAFEAGAFLVGTGRTDYPNQINNVLGFPGIFRGALDVQASDINEEMKIAAANALAELARQEVPEDAKKMLAVAYPHDAEAGMFDGKCPLAANYVIPKPFDPRVVPHVARNVAEAAMATKVARKTIDDLDAYERKLYAWLNKSR